MIEQHICWIVSSVVAVAPELELPSGRLVKGDTRYVAHGEYMCERRGDVGVHRHTSLVCPLRECVHGGPHPVFVELKPVSNAIKWHQRPGRILVRDIVKVVKIAALPDAEVVLLSPLREN